MAGNSLDEMLHEVEPPKPAVAYMHPEKSADNTQFVFQYFPESVSDNYTPNYGQHDIPGGSHPLYQYVGGSERAISFTAIFTSEVRDTGKIFKGFPAAKYTVDVAAAIASLQRYLYPTYRSGGLLGVVEPPPRLVLKLENSYLGRNEDQVLVILKGAGVEYNAFFHDGTPRIATVSLEFAECVQHSGESVSSPTSNVRYISSDLYNEKAAKYLPSATPTVKAKD